MRSLREELIALKVQEPGSEKKGVADTILPLNPIDGIQVIPRREVSLTDMDYPNRLLMNPLARQALEEEEHALGGFDDVDSDSDCSHIHGDDATSTHVVHVAKGGSVVTLDSKAVGGVVEVVEEEAEEVEEEVEEEAEEVEEEVEEEAEEEAEEQEEEGIELEEFEYKGITYYRDPDNNVYSADDDGGPSDEPYARWDPARKRIIAL